MVAGFIEPTAGRVRLGGRDVTLLPPWKRNAGMVFQSYALFPHMTVAQNVAFGLEMRKVAARRDRARASRRRCAWCGSSGFGERLPRQLSGGQQQRVALARALVIRPDVLLLDEPLSNLDAKLRQEVRVEIRELQRKLGLTTVMVTHDQEEALTMADRLVVMNEGAVRQVGTPARPLRAPGRPLRRRLRRPQHLPRRHGRGARPLPQRRRPRASPAPAATPGRGRRWRCGRSAVDDRRRAAGRTRQQPAGYGGIRLLSRRADRHPCAPVAQRPAGRADRQPRGRLRAASRADRSMSAGRRRPARCSTRAEHG